MIEINLIPDVKRELLRSKMLRNMIISISTLAGGGAIILVVVAAVILGGQLAFEGVQEGNITSKYNQLMEVEDLNKSVTLRQQLAKIEELQQDKIISSRTLTVLNSLNIKDVTFSSIKLNPEEQVISVSGSIPESLGYAGLETLKKTLLTAKIRNSDDEQDEGVPFTDEITNSQASLGESADGQKILSFSFDFKYPTELLAKSKQYFAVITPDQTINVTDSRVGVPDSLFKRNSTNNEEDAQ